MTFVTEAIYVLICVLLIGFVFKAEAHELNQAPSIHHAELQHVCSTS